MKIVGSAGGDTGFVQILEKYGKSSNLM